MYAGVESLNETLEDLVQLINKYGELEVPGAQQHHLAILIGEIRALKNEIYYEEAIRNIFDVVKAIKEGALRTAEIVKGLRSFSRPTESDIQPVDIHEHLDNTLLLLKTRFRNKIKLVRDFDLNSEPVFCYPGQLNQVFLNILNNAIQAISGHGEIRIRTRFRSDKVEIGILDNGSGIPEELKKRIFEPFFTTKPVGQGTGLGLSISYGIIQKHKGSIQMNSVAGEGTEFLIVLPLKQVKEMDMDMDMEMVR